MREEWGMVAECPLVEEVEGGAVGVVKGVAASEHPRDPVVVHGDMRGGEQRGRLSPKVFEVHQREGGDGWPAADLADVPVGRRPPVEAAVEPADDGSETPAPALRYSPSVMNSS